MADVRRMDEELLASEGLKLSDHPDGGGTVRVVNGERLIIDGLDLSEQVGIKLDATAVAVGWRYDHLAREREAYSERLLREKLPRRLHWLIDHPRLLKRVLRVVKRWEPTLTVVDLRVQPRFDGVEPSAPVTSEAAAWRLAREWIVAMRASGRTVPDSGLIFTYTDASGLPAEIYGVR